MKRKWIVWSGISLITFLIMFLIAQISSMPPDDLNWIRSYQPSLETVRDQPARPGEYNSIKTRSIQHEFLFEKGIPQALLDEDLARLEKLIIDLDKGIPTSNDMVETYPERKLVVVYRIVDRSWLDLHWRRFRRTIGLLPLRQP